MVSGNPDKNTTLIISRTEQVTKAKWKEECSTSMRKDFIDLFHRTHNCFSSFHCQLDARINCLDDFLSRIPPGFSSLNFFLCLRRSVSCLSSSDDHSCFRHCSIMSSPFSFTFFSPSRLYRQVTLFTREDTRFLTRLAPFSAKQIMRHSLVTTKAWGWSTSLSRLSTNLPLSH